MFTLRAKSKLTPRVFTYFLPSPPARKTGYREKQFDQLISSILEYGFEVESFNSQVIVNDKQSGAWFTFILRPLNSEANIIDLNDIVEGLEETSSSFEEDHLVEGLYHLEP